LVLDHRDKSSYLMHVLNSSLGKVVGMEFIVRFSVWGGKVLVGFAFV